MSEPGIVMIVALVCCVVIIGILAYWGNRL